MLLLGLLVACASGPDDGVDAPSEDGDAPAPALRAEEAVARVGTGTQHGLPDALGLYDTYLGLMASGDERCPGPGIQLVDSVVPLTGCTSSTGLTYAGVSLVETEADIAPGDTGTEARLLGGDFTIDDAAGNRMAYGGQVFWMGREERSGRTVESQALGTFVYPAGSPWLAAGVSAALYMVVERTEDGATLVLDGGLGTEGVDLWFDALTFDGTCEAGPASGSVGVRDPAGPWWTLDFGDRCDGCGTLSYPGRADTEGCVDLTSLGAATLAMVEAGP